MAVRKLSVALDESVAAAAAREAEAEGLSLSAWLNRAAERALAIREGLAAVEEHFAEHGHPSAEEEARAEAEVAWILGRDPRRP